MSGSEAAAGGAQGRSGLEAVRCSVLEILARSPVPPAVLRVRDGDAVVEIEWSPEHRPAGDGAAVRPEPAGDGAGGGTADGRHLVTAPIVGVFYRSPQPGAPPFVTEGDRVRPGQQIAIVEAMKLMIPVEADRAGVVAAVLREDGTSVEFGDELFALTVEG